MAKMKKLAILSSSLLATTMFAAFTACEDPIVSHEHKMEKQSSATKTWYACTVEGCDFTCGEEAIVAPHTHDFEVKTSTDGTKTWYECSCGAKTPEVDVVAPHTHDFEAKTNTEGTKTWYECDCGAKTPEEDVVVPHEHNFEKQSNETKTWYECDCGEKVAEEDIIIPHECSFTLEKDENNHWYECECGDKIGEAPHIWNDGEETIAPEVGVAGEYTYTCEVCGQTDTEEVPALEANPLIAAEGSSTVANYGWAYITVSLEAGEYVVLTDNEAVTHDPISVAEAGDVELAFFGFSFDLDGGTDMPFNYTVKKVPAVTPDVSNMAGEVEIVTYAWVKVSFNVPVAGKYLIKSDNAVFGATQFDGGEPSYVFATTADNEEVVFYVKALDESEDTATISYSVENIVAQNAYEMIDTDEDWTPDTIVNGPITITLYKGTRTEIIFKAAETGTYVFNTYDKDLAIYATDSAEDYTVLNQNPDWTLNQSYTFEYTEANTEKSFFITSSSSNNVTMISITKADSTSGGEEDPEEPIVTEDGSQAKPYIIDENGEAYTDLTFTAHPMIMGQFYPIYFSFTAPSNGIVDICNINNPGVVSDDNGQVDYIEDTTSFNVVAGMTYIIEIGTQDLEGSPISPEFIFTSIGGEEPEEPAEDGSFSAPFIVDAEGEVFSDVVLPTNPMTGMTANAYFSYTATQSGYVSISNVNSINGFYSDGGFVDPVTEDGLTYEVVVGTTYTIEIGQQDMEASPISPVFSFSTEAPVEEPTEDGSFGAPFVVEPEGEVFSEVELPTNPMSGATLNAYFSYTATQSGTLTVNGTGAVKAFYPENGSPVSPVEGTTYEVVVGTTYVIEVGAAADETAVSPVFVFAANA